MQTGLRRIKALPHVQLLVIIKLGAISNPSLNASSVMNTGSNLLDSGANAGTKRNEIGPSRDSSH